MEFLVSVICPVYNSEEYIEETILSVLNQTYVDWELILINDGSTDNSEKLIKQFKDSRLSYFKQENKGVSSARNVGLKKMKGDFFCFLDSDDTFEPNSIQSRIDIFTQNVDLSFVDGRTNVMDYTMSSVIKEFSPSFNGQPFNQLLNLSDSCFMGNTWMVKTDLNKSYKFNEGLTHCEDLLFYLSISSNGLYSYTNHVILNYRTGRNSAMSNLKGLENGYFSVLMYLHSLSINQKKLSDFKCKIKSIMFKSYLANFDILNSVLVLFRSQ